MPAVCVASPGGDDKTSYSEVEECEQRENLENVELGAALTTLDDFCSLAYRSIESVLGDILLRPDQNRYCAVGPRAPPAAV